MGGMQALAPTLFVVGRSGAGKWFKQTKRLEKRKAAWRKFGRLWGHGGFVNAAWQ